MIRVGSRVTGSGSRLFLCLFERASLENHRTDFDVVFYNLEKPPKKN